MIIEIDGGHSGIKFSACHFIPRHEKCSRLHGHSYILRLRLEGDIGEDGMVMDFVILKKELRKFASEMDHMILLPAGSADVSIESSEGSVGVTTCGKRYVFPEEDVRMLDVTVTTAEEMSRMLVDRLIAEVRFPSNVKRVAIGLDEERGQTAWYTKDL
ncbi:MAG: 6-pyruvoyl tetrahydropterin synthase family protein [Thermoplasmatales archaeon]|jgi:6-pyruvoyltetrahydropterin/6-carboxytetrahydropterin synthase|nr:6-pyruvoyl tetrahydropterin synthase family protein [Thermoplasmatales archaeon]